ncbi:MAG: 6-phosphogluconolactonase [candidate division NC10 bacterium]|nr:6-phosphogluconolactonase [candidate division NC10 bacterium]
MGNRDIRILADAGELSRAAAEEFVRQAEDAVRTRALFTVALSGGSTSKAMYRLLANDDEPLLRGRVPWGKIHFFWGDERHVPPDHLDSNYRTAHEAMLSRVPIPAENVHRIKAEDPDARSAAADYDQQLRTFFFPRRMTVEALPRFDLVLLGLGPDGHTASLFPGTDAIHEQTRFVAAPWVEKLHACRITLAPPVLNNAACILVLVSGEEKAEALRTVLEGAYQPDQFPAQLIRPTLGSLLWLVDRAAARLLRLPG